MDMYMVVRKRTKEIVPELARFYAAPSERLVRLGLLHELFNGEGDLDQHLEAAGLELVHADDELQARLRAFIGDKNNEGELPSGGLYRWATRS